MTEPILEVSGLSASYGAVRALRDVDLRIMPGSVVGVVGANGAGKSTLIRCLVGVKRPSSGQITLSGTRIDRSSATRIHRLGVGWSPEGRQTWTRLSVLDNLRLGGARLPRAERESAVERELHRFPALVEKAHAAAGELSGGQQQMLALSRAMVSKPRLLLLDEPSLGLAPLVVDEVLRSVREISAEGTGVLLVEQNARRALPLCDRAYVLQQGQVVMSASGAQLLRSDAVRAAFIGE